MFIIKNLDDIISGLCIAIIILVTIAGVIFRYVFNNPFGWVEEVSLGLFIWAVFMGASSAMKRGGHVSIDIIVDELGPRMRKIADIFSMTITTGLLLVVLYFGYAKAMQSGAKITPLLKVPYTYIDIAVPIGSLYMIVHMVRNILVVCKRSSQKPSTEVEL